MKKKDIPDTPPAKAGRSARRTSPYFCTLATPQPSPLDGMALRLIIADIPKHKTSDDSFETRAGRRITDATENESEK